MAGLIKRRKMTVPTTVQTASAVLCWKRCDTTWYRQWHMLRSFGENLRATHHQAIGVSLVVVAIRPRRGLGSFWGCDTKPPSNHHSVSSTVLPQIPPNV